MGHVAKLVSRQANVKCFLFGGVDSHDLPLVCSRSQNRSHSRIYRDGHHAVLADERFAPMSTSTPVTHRPASLTAPASRRIVAGVLGGVAGGAVFGMLMAMMGMLPVIASMVGSDSAWVGFAVHMMISIGIGLGLTVLFGNRLLTGYGRGVVVGLAYGAIWWVLGPLLIMPMM